MKWYKNVLWFGSWMSLVLLYTLSLMGNFYVVQATEFIYFAQFLFDALLIYFCVLAYLKTPIGKSKLFFGLLSMSMILSVISNEVYNIGINVVKMGTVTPVIDFLWTAPYVIFLLIQILAWSYLLLINRNAELPNKTWLSKMPYLQAVMAITLLMFMALVFKNSFLQNMDWVQSVNALLETVLFIILLLALTRSKSTVISILAMGFLFAIAFNLAHRFGDLSGHYDKIFSAIWLMCPMILVLGFMEAAKKPLEKVEFFESHSIPVLISTFVLLASFISIVFVIVGFLLSSMGLNEMATKGFQPENIASVLIFSFSLSILLSKLSANYFSAHLNRLADHVHRAQHNPVSLAAVSRAPIPVYELDKLNHFILDTLDQLQAANRVKSEFLMNMSHDFRTPASGIYQLSSSLYKRMPDNELKRFQKMMVEASRQLLDLLDQVLQYSNLESGNAQHRLENFDLVVVIDEIIQFVRPKVVEKGLRLETQFSEPLIHYQGDRSLLQRALLNLIANAIKFTEQGEICITAEKSVSTKMVKITIKDTGIGIAPEHHASIFEAFFRVQPGNSAFPGVGLGLRNVKLTLEKMRGQISVESRLGEGALFMITLPL